MGGKGRYGIDMKCDCCNGKGYIDIEEECRTCSGTGKAKGFNPEVTKELTSEQLSLFLKGICGICGGKGKTKKRDVCKTCFGKGHLKKCLMCGKPATRGGLCPSCAKKPHAYLLKDSCGLEDVDKNSIYVGTVSGIAPIGVFVDLNKRVRGLIRKKDMKNNPKTDYSVGEQIVVKVIGIKHNGEVDLIENPFNEYSVIEISKDAPEIKNEDVEKFLGKMVGIKGKITHLKVTGGPTIFTILDETGIVNAAAFEGGERAFPEINIDEFVIVKGIVKRRNMEIQIEIFEMEKLLGEEANILDKKIRKELEKKCEPNQIGFLIKSDVLERLRWDLENVARELRRAIFECRPIIIRHHWDADGVCGGVSIEKALNNFILKTGNTELNFLVKRKVSRAPFYELEDLVKDLSESLEDKEKFGDKIPLVVLVDNGSTCEDIPAIKQFLVFGADVITIDHHFPDEEVDKYLLHHVNPYKVGGDSNYTAGVLCVELSRMIESIPNPELIAGVSLVGDRATGEVEEYIKISGLEKDWLKRIGLAIEYEGFFLRFRTASQIFHEILGFGRKDRHEKLVMMLSDYANQSIDMQVKTAMEGVKVQKLPNGVTLAALDIENYAKRFTFPPPGKLTGEVHDILKNEHPMIVTLGYGPDFTVIRSEGVKMDIPKLVREIKEEINAGVDGGGHLVVGSLKFIPAKRKEVLAKLAAKISLLST